MLRAPVPARAFDAHESALTRASCSKQLAGFASCATLPAHCAAMSSTTAARSGRRSAGGAVVLPEALLGLFLLLIL